MTDQATKLPNAVGYGTPPEEFTAELWESIKSFLEFGADDAKRLRAAHQRYASDIPSIVEQFYDHLLSFKPTLAVLERADVNGRLKVAQVEYLGSLGGGHYGEAYLRDRLRIGLTHERIGLAPRWYLGSYWILCRELIPRLLTGAPAAERDNLLSLLKIMLLDMVIATESYVGRTVTLMNAQNEQLEDIVRERTRQLSKWERLAAVGSLAAKVAHEIRNPLSSIMLNTDLIDDELKNYEACDTREARELLSAITGELDRLSRIVDEYLQFARMPRLELEPVDLRDLAEQVVKFLMLEFERLRIDTEIEGNSHAVLYLDRNQFRQVLLNLLRNSQEAMPEGGKITIHIRERQDGSCELVVVDTGVGIHAGHVEKVFDPFYSTKDTGTGLGLAFVQQVVQEHGGEVSCTSQPGRGAAFQIVLPEGLRVGPQVPESGR